MSVILELLKNSWITAVGVPVCLVYTQGAAKAASRRYGPSPLTFFLRPSKVRRNDRALGLDLLFAAAGSLLSFLAGYAVGVGSRSVDSGVAGLLASLRIHVQDKAELSIYLLLVVAVTMLVVATATRLHGHEPTSPDSDLREEFVTAPNLVGFLLLFAAWGLAAP